MSEASAGYIAVLLGGKQGAEEQHKAVRVLMVLVECLGDQIQRVTADLVHGAAAIHDETIVAYDTQCDFCRAHLLDAEGFIEQSDKRPKRG
ncbi:hypothetical protein D9M69_700560 [compost metagenome]